MQGNRVNRRHFLKLTASTAGGAILAACAPKAPEVVEKEVTRIVGGTPQVVKETVVATAEPKPVELNLLMVDWNEDSRKVFEEVTIPQFQEEHPGWTVAVDYTDWGQLDVKVMTAFAGGLQPDVFQADNVEFGPKYHAKGIIAELNPLIDSTAGAREKVADFYEKAIFEGSTIGGNLVALPYVLDNRGLFYRSDFLKEVGLDPEKPPETWEDFRAAAIAMTIREGDTFKRVGWWSNTGQFCFQTFVPFLWQNGGELMAEDGSEVTYDSPEAIEALEFWTKLIREDRVGPVEEMESPGDMSLMTAGILAMSFSGYWQLLNVQKYAPDLWDSQGVTVLGHRQKASLWYANTYFLSKGAKVEEAWVLLSALVLDDDNFTQYHEAMGGLPPRKSISEKAKHITPKHMVLIDDVMNAPGSHTTPAVPYTMEILERIDEACQKALYGEATPKEALAQAAQEGNQIIERHKGS